MKVAWTLSNAKDNPSPREQIEEILLVIRQIQ